MCTCINIHLSQRMTKPTLISLIRVSADPMCFLGLQAIQRGIIENPCQTGWMYSLICVFAGHTALIVGTVDSHYLELPYLE